MSELPHGPLCTCDHCVSARKRGAQKGLESFKKVVAIAARLKVELENREALYQQANEDRLALLNITAGLATAYHDLGVKAQLATSIELGLGAPRLAVDIREARHAEQISECTHEVCLAAREGLLAIGQNRTTRLVQAEIDV